MGDEDDDLDRARAFVPPGFDKRDPAYQRAWLVRNIAVLRTEIAEQETEFQKRREAHRRKKDEQQKRGFLRNLFSDPLGTDGLAEISRSFVTGLGLDVKERRLIELEARLEALSQSSLPPAQRTRQQQIDTILAEVAALKAESAKICAAITDEATRDQIEQDYEDRIRKKYQQVAKL